MAALCKCLTRLRDAAANIERMELKLDLDCVCAYLSEKKLLHNEAAFTLQFLGFSFECLSFQTEDSTAEIPAQNYVILFQVNESLFIITTNKVCLDSSKCFG